MTANAGTPNNIPRIPNKPPPRRIDTITQNADSPVRLSAITAGGSQAVFFKVNTLGEESFLDDVKELLEEILEE